MTSTKQFVVWAALMTILTVGLYQGASFLGAKPYEINFVTTLSLAIIVLAASIADRVNTSGKFTAHAVTALVTGIAALGAAFAITFGDNPYTAVFMTSFAALYVCYIFVSEFKGSDGATGAVMILLVEVGVILGGIHFPWW